MLQKTCRDFADNELKPIAAKIDREHLYPKEQIQKMGELGLMGLVVPEENGKIAKNYRMLIRSKEMKINSFKKISFFLQVELVLTIWRMPLQWKRYHVAVHRPVLLCR